jgi:hypothetical protein
VARAIVLAATQAIANAFQHADGAGLIVTVRADAASVECGSSTPGAASIRATSRRIASASAVRSWRAWRRSADVRA